MNSTVAPAPGTAGTRLENELANWKRAGVTARLFLRDDDAVADTAALRKLFAMCESAATPLLLATIPEPASADLGKAVAAFGLATGAVHGFRHANYSPKGEKTCELGVHRPLEKVIAELSEGRQKLLELFDGRLSGLLVPPWNRIHNAVAARVGIAGFSGISGHGWLVAPPAHRLANVNVHLDIIHWSGGKVGRSLEWIDAELAAAFGEARRRGWRAIGILTHHLVHDQHAWAGLKHIMDVAAGNGLRWIDAESLIGEPAETASSLIHQA